MSTTDIIIEVQVEKSRDKDGTVSELNASHAVPLLVFASDDEYKLLKTKLGELAKRGILLAISKEFFENLRGQDIARTKAYVDEMTRHNDKLGYDWYKPDSNLVVSVSEHFNESAYKNFVTAGAKFVESAYPGHARVLEQMGSKFAIPRKDLLKPD